MLLRSVSPKREERSRIREERSRIREERSRIGDPVSTAPIHPVSTERGSQPVTVSATVHSA
ncbi:MAG: hypothetical protein WKF29_09090, partial [Thermoleophilaceae bacterium]